MNEIEDRLRAAARAAANTVPSGSAPPLRLPARPGGHFSLPGQLHKVAGRMIIAPVAAATAVAAVVTVSLVVTGGVPSSGRARIPGGTATSCATPGSAPSAKPTPGARASAQAALASVPPYYVAITRLSASLQNAAVVRDTATGAALATLTPLSPYGMFTQVTAAADDRTFVLAATLSPTNQNLRQYAGQEPTGLFLLCLNAAGQPTEGLTALPITVEPSGAAVNGIALSPDASRLAVEVSKGQGPGSSEIDVFTLATGSATDWQWPTLGWVGNWKPYGSPLSWTANGQTLAFQAWQEHETPQTGSLPPRLHKNVKVSLTTEVRLLDAEGPGGSLASTTLVDEWSDQGSDLPGTLLLGTNTIITPDGTKIVCVTGTQSSASAAATSQPSGVATEYSVSTGKIVGFLGVQPTESSAGSAGSVITPVQNVLWSSPTGSTLIVATSTGAGILTGGQFTPIPGYPPLTGNVAW